MELLETLERYTVLQLVFATPLMYIILLIVRTLTFKGSGAQVDPITKLFARFIDKLDKVDASVSKVEDSVDKEADILEKLIQRIELGDQNQTAITKLICSNLEDMRDSINNQKVAIGDTKEAINQMADDINAEVKRLADKVSEGLSDENRNAFAELVASKMSANVKSDIATNNDVLMRLIRVELQSFKEQLATQEATATPNLKETTEQEQATNE